MKFLVFLLLSPLAMAKPCRPSSYVAVTTTSSSTAPSQTSSSAYPASYPASSSYNVPSNTTAYATSSSTTISSSTESSSSSSSTSSLSTTSSATLTPSSTTSSTTTTTTSAIPQPTCGFQSGYPTDTANRLSTAIFISLTQCRDICVSHEACKTYVYSDFLGGCSVYSTTADELLSATDGSETNYFYDVACVLPSATTSSEMPVRTISLEAP
ncbi:hypothetical protein GGS26DRAFT_549616 [Hypomontagnella submonticulosa]|nr:hypothetical protein GGS26DRAFT_549616 [Hypomontagnella submonticulosa]